MTVKAPGHHEIGGYVVDRVDDGETVTWEVIHPETGLATTVDTLPEARAWIREHPIPQPPKPPKPPKAMSKGVPYRTQRKAGLVCRAKKRDNTFCTATTVQGSLYCGRHTTKEPRV